MPASAITALVSVVAGITLKWVMEQICTDCVPNVEIVDPPFESQGGTEIEGAKGAESGGDITTCSPQVLHPEAGRMHQGWFWFPLQFALALLLLRIGRKRGMR